MAVEAVALALPHGHKKRVGIGGTHRQIDDARLVIDMKNAVPRLAAVGRLEKSALWMRAIKPAERADIDDIRVLRMDDYLADLERLLEAHVFPRLAAVGRLVDTVSIGNGVARIGLAGAGP